jgi:hypothetical protein
MGDVTKRLPLRGGPLQKEIIAAGHRKGWKVAHFTQVFDGKRNIWRTPAVADGKGWPDLVLVRDRLVVVEVKGDGDKLRADQERWIAALLKAGVETYVWTPVEWFDGTVDKVLA